MRAAYYAVVDSYGPLSLRLGEWESWVEAAAEFERLHKIPDSTGRLWVDAMRTDVEDDWRIPGRPCMEENEFAALLLAAGFEEPGCWFLVASCRVVLWRKPI